MRKVFYLLLVVGVFAATGCKDSDNPFAIEVNSDMDKLLKKEMIVQLNPNGTTPLAALLEFETKDASTVEVTVGGAIPVTKNFDTATKEHSHAILGLYPGMDNTVTITVSTTDGAVAQQEVTVTTAALPDAFPTVNVTTANESQMEPGWHLMEASQGVTADARFASKHIMFDNNGVIRWYFDFPEDVFTDMVFPMKRFANGNWLVCFHEDYYEYDMLGNEINKWSSPGYKQHHGVLELPNGNIVSAVNKDNTGTVEDHIIEIDRNSGAIVREWDMRDILDMSRQDLVPDSIDWFHMNAIFYDEASDALIISGRNQGVVKVTMNNELVWILAPHLGWGQAGENGDGYDTNDFLLTAVDANGTPYNDSIQYGSERFEEFEWAWGQHAPLILPNGNLFVFDNGFNRNFSQDPSYSRGVEYEIDEAAKTVKQVWQYGRERGPAYQSIIISDVDYLPTTQNRLLVSGIQIGAFTSYMTEVDNAGNVIFEVVLTHKNSRATGDFAWGGFDISYRGHRMPLYPN